MFLQVSLIVALLGVTVVNASAKCLSSNEVGAANYQLCCPDGQGSGKGTVGATTFEYACSQYYTGKSGPGTMHRQVNSAKECAQLCAAKADCPGSSWQSTQKRCWVLGSGNTDFASFSPAKNWMTLTRSPEKPDEPDPKKECKDQVDAAKGDSAKQCSKEKGQLQSNCQADKDAAIAAANSQCATEKDQLRQQGAAQCQSEKDSANAQCTKEKGELQKQVDDARAQCKADKEKAVAAANAQCAAEKEQLKKQCEADKASSGSSAGEQCAAEKDKLQKQCQADKESAVAGANSQCATEKDKLQKQCETEKSGLQSQLKECKDKSSSGVSSGEGGGQWKLADAQCRDNSWHNLCDGACTQRKFTLGGVDWQVKCNVRTNGMVEELWWHRQSILECAEACALTPRCLGVGWRKSNLEPERGVCHAHIRWDHTHSMVNTAFPYGGGEHLIYAPARITPTGAPGT